MVEDMTPYEALMLAVERAGSLSALARKMPCSVTAVWKWVQSSKRVPEKYVLNVEAVTNVPRHLLRPDIYPADLGPGPKWNEGRWSDPRWMGIDMAATGSDVAVVAAIGPRRNGNRINVLDKSTGRRAIG
jgi:DNA-binding transcriptional regulator YdaS (Cro superfamily)